MATTGTFLKPIFIAGTSYPVGAATIDDALVSQLPRDTFIPAVEPVTGGEDDVKARRAAGFLDTGLADGKVPVWNATQGKYVPGTVASENSGSVAAADITDAGTAGIAVLQAETAAQGRTALDIPNSSGRDINQVVTIMAWGDSLTAGQGGTPYPTQLVPITGFNVTNKGVGGETAAQIATRFLADTANYPKSYVLWAGRNDVKTATTVESIVASIQSCVTAAGHGNYLIVGVTTGLDLSDTQMTKVAAINAALSSAFSGNYYDLNADVLANGLSDCGITPTGADLAAIASGRMPPSLSPDNVHFNTAGYGFVARRIKDRLSIILGSDYARTMSLAEVVRLSLIEVTGLPRKAVNATYLTLGVDTARLSLGADDASFQYTGSLWPSVNDSKDIGYTSLKWRNGLFSRDVTCRAIIEPAATTPASATATGVQGTIVWDAGYIYVCTATNTWKRAALATW